MAPQLIAARMTHSRIVMLLAVVLVMISEPWIARDSALHQAMLWLGYLLVIAGAFGRLYCVSFIGGRKNDEIVRVGPFSVVRNPLYVFSFVAVLGVGLQSGMFVLLALLVGVFVSYYPFVVAREEAYLRQHFGATYEAYLREVPRWLPDFRLWREPEQAVFRPARLRRAAFDTALFFLPLPLFSLSAALHSARILPTELLLP